MLPFIVGGIAVATALTGYNIKKGMDRKREANKIKKDIELDLEFVHYKMEKTIDILKEQYEEIDKLYLSTYEEEFEKFKNIVKRLQKNIKINPISQLHNTFNSCYKEINIINHNLSIIKIIQNLTIGTVTGGITGSLCVAGVVGVATAIGTASTGTAISSLSGIAFQKALLAYIGGGTLATGGLGITGGTIALGGVFTAPVIVFVSIAFSKTMEEYLTEIKKWEKTQRRKIEEMYNQLLFMEKHVEDLKQFQKYFKLLKGKLSRQLNLLEDIVNKYLADAKNNEIESTLNSTLESSLVLIKTIRKIMDKPIEKNCQETSSQPVY
ncbi:hypothetical protein [Persephonella sp.]